MGFNGVVTSRHWEITDLLWEFDKGGARLPTRRDAVTQRLLSGGQRRAARIVEGLPERDGYLIDEEIDRLGIRVHCELQRLTEELQLARRVAELISPLVGRLAEECGHARLIDIGAGIGYVVRWLAASRALDPRVELVGVDINPVLVRAAARLAGEEGLACVFARGDALDLARVIEHPDSTVLISTAFLHHLAPDDLSDFFAAHERLGVAAFAHWDIAPCLVSTLGAWVFHRARMREPVSRYDGVLSAVRAHPADALLGAARAGAPGYRAEVHQGGQWHPRAIDVLRPITGVRR
jgi:hypothetical protein